MHGTNAVKIILLPHNFSIPNTEIHNMWQPKNKEERAAVKQLWFRVRWSSHCSQVSQHKEICKHHFVSDSPKQQPIPFWWVGLSNPKQRVLTPAINKAKRSSHNTTVEKNLPCFAAYKRKLRHQHGKGNWRERENSTVFWFYWSTLSLSSEDITQTQTTAEHQELLLYRSLPSPNFHGPPLLIPSMPPGVLPPLYYNTFSFHFMFQNHKNSRCCHGNQAPA